MVMYLNECLDSKNYEHNLCNEQCVHGKYLCVKQDVCSVWLAISGIKPIRSIASSKYCVCYCRDHCNHLRREQNGGIDVLVIAIGFVLPCLKRKLDVPEQNDDVAQPPNARCKVRVKINDLWKKRTQIIV